MDTFVFPNPIHFGPGSIASLSECLDQLNLERPLLVTDEGLRECGLLEEALSRAKLNGRCPIFSDVDSNPTERNVTEGVSAYRESNCDGVIGFGGGSALDAAKGIRLMSCHEGPLADYAIAAKGWERMTETLPAMIAIPTTSGTGSEVARGALLIEESRGAKIAVVGPKLFPSMTLCDPELTLGLSSRLTAGTGMDALTHCIEEYLSPNYNPAIEGLALEGIRRSSKSLKMVVEDGTHLEARSDMMIAAMLGGMGFAKGLGVVHSLSHGIGALYGGHHGTLNGILLPASLEFNRRCCEAKFRPMAQAAGLLVERLSDSECASAFIDYISDLNRSLEIPERLTSWKIDPDQMDKLIALCQMDHCHLTNPRPVGESDFRELLVAHL